MDFFSTQNILVHIPIGAGGTISLDRGRGDDCRAVVYLAGEPEKISNYAFGLVNVTLFAIIFFQIQLYASLLLQLFFLPQTFMAGMHGRDKAATMRLSCRSAGCRAAKRWAGWRPAW